MKLLFLIGDPTSENMPVGQALAGISGFRLFHSQMMLSPVRELFGGENIQAVRRLCDVVLEESALSDQYGLIFILNRKPEQKDVWDSIEHIQKILAPYSVQFYCVDLAMRRQAQVLNAGKTCAGRKPSGNVCACGAAGCPGPVWKSRAVATGKTCFLTAITFASTIVRLRRKPLRNRSNPIFPSRASSKRTGLCACGCVHSPVFSHSVN